MDNDIKSDVGVEASMVAGKKLGVGTRHQHIFEVECYGPDGNLKWTDVIENLVVNTGLDEILDKFYKGSGYTAAHYIGLTDGTPDFQAADTLASSAWTEVSAYDEAVRQPLTMGTVSGQSVDNDASKGQFTIDTNSTTIGGAFIALSSTKDETASILVGGGAFTAGDKSLDDNDTLNVKVTATNASS